MSPLRVTATLRDAIILTLGTIALDSLLAALYAMVHRLQTPTMVEEPPPLPLPLQREPGGRFDLASFACPHLDQFEVTHMHKAFPVHEARAHTQMWTVNQKSGINKSWRLPLSLAHAENDVLTWWCLGDQDGIEALLQFCHHLGRKRAQGMGRVREWRVEPCEPWGEGFPVVLEGKPLRNLPPDWPGLVDPEIGMTRLTYPYWTNAPRKQLCAMPEVGE